ncbi:hypothetical protein K501DRAFT_329013 [Backusella circina FSU 941]|nr:hypothetical protein K501DRAFT_329013 [Backusella circina FSU 941]
MQRDEEMNKRESSLLGSIKSTISRSTESAILEFERICDTIGWRRSTLVDSQKIKRRRNKTDIYKRVLSDNTRRSAVRDMEIQTEGGYTPPLPPQKTFSYNEKAYNNNNNKPTRSRQNNAALVKGISQALERKEPPLPQRERSFPSPQSTTAIPRTMSTQTLSRTSSPEPQPTKEVSSGLLTPERSSTSMSSSIDADPVTIGRKHNITPSPDRAVTTSPKRSATRPTIVAESPGSVSQLRSQIEEQLKSPYRSPTRFNVERTPERRAIWADNNLNNKSSSPSQRLDMKKKPEQEDNITSPIRTSPIRPPYANGSPSRKRNMLSPSSSVSPPRKKYIPDSPGSVKRLAFQIENELKFPYLRPGMVIPKLTASPVKKAESPTKPSNILHKVVLHHHNDLDFEEEGQRIARLEREIKNVGTEVSMLGSYTILNSPEPTHVSSEIPNMSPITPTSTHHDPSCIPKAPPFIKRPAKELIREAEMKRGEQLIKEIATKTKPKVLKPTEMHKSKMREIITLVPHFKLRKTNMIPGPNGEMISNRFWSEIYQPKIRN